MTNKKKYSRIIAERIEMFFNDKKWKCDFKDEDGIFRIGMRTKGCRINYLDIFIIVHKKAFSTYARYPLQVDLTNASLLMRMAEFVCRVNCDIKQGSLIFNHSDGRLYCRNYTDCTNTIVSDEVIENSINCAAVMMENSSYGISGLVNQDITALEAVRFCQLTHYRFFLESQGVKEEEMDRLSVEFLRRLDEEEASAE